MIQRSEVADLRFPVSESNVTASETIFVNDTKRTFVLKTLAVRFGTTSSSGTLQAEVAGAGVALGSGVNQLPTTLSLSGTANNNVVGDVTTPTLITPGSALNVILGGTLTGLANCCIVAELEELI